MTHHYEVAPTFGSSKRRSGFAQFLNEHGQWLVFCSVRPKVN